ncbi:hypothetical protein GCM10023318_03710 [Nocardia callitridis]|uniref:RNA polymerase alpha subunit C-terminal domain-containing protein n=1 Tax=Nocardia callitridis TaxID=648753 RepID=A0ABP9JTQ7_9NOCA
MDSDLVREQNVEAEGIEISPSPAEADHIASFGLPIEDLDLTVRSYNCRERAGVHTVGELVARTDSDLLDRPDFDRPPQPRLDPPGGQTTDPRSCRPLSPKCETFDSLKQVTSQYISLARCYSEG